MLDAQLVGEVRKSDISNFTPTSVQDI